MIIQELSIFKYPLIKALNKMKGLNKSRKKFMVQIIGLFLSIKGPLNFLQLERFSDLDEQSFRNQFEKTFDFMSLNKDLVLENGSGHYTIAFDPSYISKAGKLTPGVGYHWSGCAGKVKWGLEISGIAAIDIGNHTAFHLEAVQTLNVANHESLLTYYASILVDRKDELLAISKYIVADAYFSKAPFVSCLNKNGFEVVSRLRDDADLLYLFTGEQRGGRGRPKKYGEKVNFKSLMPEVFQKVNESEKTKTYAGIVYSKAFKRNVNVVIVFTKRKEVWKHKIYFSTDLKLEPNLLLEYYQTRFQIEFLYRDGKQNTGLDDCQARSENKLDFHFNIALTTINIAKITHWISIQKEKRKSFSMADIKTMYNNQLIMKRIFSMFAINPNLTKNKKKIRELLDYGKIAA